MPCRISLRRPRDGRREELRDLTERAAGHRVLRAARRRSARASAMEPTVCACVRTSPMLTLKPSPMGSATLWFVPLRGVFSSLHDFWWVVEVVVVRPGVPVRDEVHRLVLAVARIPLRQVLLHRLERGPSPTNFVITSTTCCPASRCACRLVSRITRGEVLGLEVPRTWSEHQVGRRAARGQPGPSPRRPARWRTRRPCEAPCQPSPRWPPPPSTSRRTARTTSPGPCRSLLQWSFVDHPHPGQNLRRTTPPKVVVRRRIFKR